MRAEPIASLWLRAEPEPLTDCIFFPASFQLFALIVVHALIVVGSMDQWRERLLATRELFLEDDEEDDFNVNWVMELGLNAPRG